MNKENNFKFWKNHSLASRAVLFLSALALVTTFNFPLVYYRTVEALEIGDINSGNISVDADIDNSDNTNNDNEIELEVILETDSEDNSELTISESEISENTEDDNVDEESPEEVLLPSIFSSLGSFDYGLLNIDDLDIQNPASLSYDHPVTIEWISGDGENVFATEFEVNGQRGTSISFEVGGLTISIPEGSTGNEESGGCFVSQGQPNCIIPIHITISGDITHSDSITVDIFTNSDETAVSQNKSFTIKTVNGGEDEQLGTSSITIIKQVTGDSPEDWSFNFDFFIDILHIYESEESFTISNSPGFIAKENLLSGEYTIIEKELPEDWSFLGVSCNSINEPFIDGQSVLFNLEEGENVTCIFMNHFGELDLSCPIVVKSLEPEKSADLNGNGVVQASDLTILLSTWGDCADEDNCPADLNNDGAVDSKDLQILLNFWGSDGNLNSSAVVSSADADFNQDLNVGPADLAVLLGNWGVCDDPENCPADLNGDGIVDDCDLNLLLSFWGPVDVEDGGNGGGNNGDGDNNGSGGGNNGGSNNGGSSGGGGGSGGFITPPEGQVLGTSSSILEEELKKQLLDLMQQLLRLLQSRLAELQSQQGLLAEQQIVPQVLGEFAEAQEINGDANGEGLGNEIDGEMSEQIFSGTSSEFDSEETAEEGNRIWLWIIFIIILAILLYLALRKKE